MERPRTDQALVVAGSFASGYVVGSGYTQVVRRVTVAPPVLTDAVAGIASAAFAVLAGPKLRTTKPGALAVTAAQARSYASAAAITMDLARRSVGAARSRGRLAHGVTFAATGAALDAPRGILHIAPQPLAGDEKMRVPFFFPRFWAMMTLSPSVRTRMVP